MMKRYETQRGIATITALITVIAVLVAGGAVVYTYSLSEQQAFEGGESQQRLTEEGMDGDTEPATEDEKDIVPVEEQQNVEETTVEERTKDEQKTVDDTTTGGGDDEVKVVSTPATVELVAGESVRLDGAMTLTLVRAVLYERPSGGQADFRLSDSGGCGEGASSECIGPPGFQNEFSISETETDAIESGGYSFTLLQLGPSTATVKVERR